MVIVLSYPCLVILNLDNDNGVIVLMHIYDRVAKKMYKQNGDGHHWIWSGATNHQGIPNIVAGKDHKNPSSKLSVPRVLYEKHFGCPPEGPLYRKCSDRRCVNPSHFGYTLRMDAVLNEYQKEEIKERYRLSEKWRVTMESLGNDYGVTKQRIEQILNEKVDSDE